MKNRKRLKNIWHLLRHRCCAPHNKDYANYGGRGIRVCDEWQDFECFYSWAIENGHKPTLSIDRIDNDGDYEPGNCRWADKKTQANNRRTNVLIEFDGRTQTMSQWADEIGITVYCMNRRLNAYNWPLDKALTTTVGKRRYITFNGRTQRLYEWANETGISPDALDARLNRHKWSVERALTTPVRKYPTAQDNF